MDFRRTGNTNWENHVCAAGNSVDQEKLGKAVEDSFCSDRDVAITVIV
jgi:hypothetical protein